MKRLKLLEQENGRLRRVVADLMLGRLMLKEAAQRRASSSPAARPVIRKQVGCSGNACDYRLPRRLQVPDLKLVQVGRCKTRRD